MVVTLLAPIVVLLLTPAIRPFRWSRLFWTYVIPAVPALVLFDGIVSCLRIYSPEELRALEETAAESGVAQWRRAHGPGKTTSDVR